MAAPDVVTDLGNCALMGTIVAIRKLPGHTTASEADEAHLHLVGFVSFRDQPKPDVAASLQHLARLGVTVKVATGDNATVAQTVCDQLGLTAGATMTGEQIDVCSPTASGAVVGSSPTPSSTC